MENATAETADTGVNTEAQATEPVETPTTGEESPTSEKESGEVEVQLSTKAQQRMQKLANEAREAKQLKAENQKLSEQIKQAEAAMEIDRWLKEDPRRISEFVNLVNQLSAPKNPQDVKDPYEGFDPVVAERFKKYDSIAEKIEQFENQQKQNQQQFLIDNQSKLDTQFEKLLQDKGFADEKGIVDDSLSYTLSRGTLAVLAETVDPRLATEQQLQEAFDKFTAGIQSLEKRALKKVVRPAAPPSGSNKGAIPAKAKNLTDDSERFALMASMLRSRTN